MPRKQREEGHGSLQLSQPLGLLLGFWSAFAEREHPFPSHFHLISIHFHLISTPFPSPVAMTARDPTPSHTSKVTPKPVFHHIPVINECSQLRTALLDLALTQSLSSCRPSSEPPGTWDANLHSKLTRSLRFPCGFSPNSSRRFKR